MSNVAAAAQARLGALRVVRVHLPSVDSTNKYATAHVRTFDPHVVTVVTADEQTAGRGRMGRVWKSGADDVKATFAFALPAHAVATAYQLSPLVAVVATRVLRRQGVDVGIKWPNDLMIAGSRKFAGILCELEHVLGEGPADPPRYWAALGIGINVNSAKEALEEAVGPRPVWPLTTLRSETGRTYDVTALADELVAEFAEVCVDTTRRSDLHGVLEIVGHPFQIGINALLLLIVFCFVAPRSRSLDFSRTASPPFKQTTNLETFSWGSAFGSSRGPLEWRAESCRSARTACCTYSSPTPSSRGDSSAAKSVALSWRRVSLLRAALNRTTVCSMYVYECIAVA